MSEDGPRLSSRRFWAERERRCLAILGRALMLLRDMAEVPESEVDLNRCLYFCLSTASSELFPNEIIAHVSECNNQPDSGDATRAARELKRPDFQWVYRDRYESDPHRSNKQFVVECKRIGKSVRADWVFNLNYVGHGVARFRDSKWGYGAAMPSGAMVGYWQSMAGEQLVKEINDEAQRIHLPALTLIDTWNERSVTRLEHEFERPIMPSPFRLHHLWIDLRVE
ncbi:MAG: hypothetical protein WEB58_12555 [Planctomycetaceae bacterium]